ncbi:Two-component transcriptional response regulator, LuxR family [hydrothermal vent metagenome]|uniref:Two-component transcriptional response regulator, LuxR family n=1 Tax=hydrothermal vent metagenome TaxID=652676 RepID=A0A3B1DMH9_9ZZZZ
MKSSKTLHNETQNNPTAYKKYLRVLIVEDHLALAENLSEFLDEASYALDFAYDGLTALHLVSVNRYDVIVLDIMLPGLSGLQICERIRRDLQCNTPIIFMTARDAIGDKEAGFLRGGDDYLVKPFEMREMELRIQALARRGAGRQDEIVVESLRYDTGTFTVSLNKKKVGLSGTNIRLFEALIRAYPRFVSHEILSHAAWGVDDIPPRTLRTHIYNLRKLLNEALGHALIKTLRGQGYRLLLPEEG